MVFFSDLKNKKVRTQDRVTVGKLDDLIFSVSDNPKITKIVVKKRGEKIIIPADYLIKIGADVIIDKSFEEGEISEKELYIEKNLLNVQIIDIKGNKVVRVNDVVIQDRKEYIISGVDIGFLGVLRFLGLDDIVISFFRIFGKNLSPNILPWKDIQPLELTKGSLLLKKEEEKIERIHPADLADYLEQTNVNNVVRFVNTSLDKDFIGDVIDNLNINYQTAVFEELKPKKAAQILEYVDPDEAVDILLTLSKRRRSAILKYLKPEIQKELEYLMQMSKTPIGELMTSEYLTVSPEMRLKEVVQIIKKKGDDFPFLNYIYVLNSKKQLVGVFSLYELISNDQNTRVYKVMVGNVISIYLTTPKELALKKMLKYKLSALPVISSDKIMLGMVTFDDLSEELIEKL